MANDAVTSVPVYDWSRFVKKVPVHADEQALYACWATAQGIEKWFLRKAIFRNGGKQRSSEALVQAGDEYEWYWHGWSDETVERGQITDANGTDRFSFSFGKAGDVKVTIRKGAGICMVELLQENIPVDEYSKQFFHLGCSTGWTFYLANLKSVLEGGLDLRNRNPDIKDVVNA